MQIIKKCYLKFLSKFAFCKTTRHNARKVLLNYNKFINKGNNNKLIFVENGKEYIAKNPNKKLNSNDESNSLPIENTKINLSGNNITLKINLPITLQNMQIDCSSDNVDIELGKGCVLRDSNIVIWGGQKKSVVKIGENCSIWKNFKLFVSGAASFIMGDDCMLSYDITIWNGDGHCVLDKESRRIINVQKEPLIIGKHSWISNNVLITKNAKISNNTIVGMGTVVSRKFQEEYTCIAGNPAKVVKTSVDWDKSNVNDYQKDML